MSGISTLSGVVKVNLQWTAQQNITGTDYTPVQSSGNIQKQQTFSTSINNNLLGGSDEIISYIVSIAATASATVVLTNLTNVLQTSAVSLARVKQIIVRLLSTTDDTVNGTACTQVTVGGNATTPFNGNALGGTISSATAASPSVVTINAPYSVPPAGTFIIIQGATGATNLNAQSIVYNVSGQTFNLETFNTSSGAVTAINSAAALTNTPTWTLASPFAFINNGGCYIYWDTTATGFAPITTGMNTTLKISNVDTGHAAAVQLSLIGGSS